MTTPNWSAFSPMLGEVNLLDIDPNGPGPFKLAGGIAPTTFGRASYYADIIEGWDPILGAGEFIFAQALTAIAPGQVVQFSCTQDGSNNLVLQATPWLGTANSGAELGVAISAVGTGQWGWMQLSGFAVVDHGPTTAGQAVSSVTILGNTATFTTGSAHSLVVGETVNVSGFTPASYNGSYLVTSVPTTTIFTVAFQQGVAPVANPTVLGSYTFYAGSVAGQTVSSGANATLVATLTTAVAHGLQVGDVVTVIGATPAAYNVTNAVVTAVGSPTTFSYNMLTNPGGVTTVQPTYTVTSPAINGQAYFSGNGAVAGVIVASKHMLGSQWAVGTAGVAGQLGSVTQGKTLPAWQAVLYIGRPTAQGAIT
jgi:hypothetical protein